MNDVDRGKLLDEMIERTKSEIETSKELIRYSHPMKVESWKDRLRINEAILKELTNLKELTKIKDGEYVEKKSLMTEDGILQRIRPLICNHHSCSDGEDSKYPDCDMFFSPRCCLNGLGVKIAEALSGKIKKEGVEEKIKEILDKYCLCDGSPSDDIRLTKKHCSCCTGIRTYTVSELSEAITQALTKP